MLFRHSADSFEALHEKLEALCREVDVSLLWEMLVSEEDFSEHEATDLAGLYFKNNNDDHASAIFRALDAEKLHFRRKNRSFIARSDEEIAELHKQRESVERSARELADLTQALKRRALDKPLAKRLERYLRFGGDRALQSALEQVAKFPERYAFNLLLEKGHLPHTLDLEVLRNNLQSNFPQAVLEHVAALAPPSHSEPPLFCAFSIDDPETREVDDALTISEEGGLTRVDIDIADVASTVKAQDPVDNEALRRATTLYLPTQTYYMLPEQLSCDMLSLKENQPRFAVRTSVWLDENAAVVRFEHARVFLRVEKRLDYQTVDRLLQTGESKTALALRQLSSLAAKLAARRRKAGSLSFQQREWKIRVSPDGQTITVKMIPPNSPSRSLVAEMMILANHLTAKFAAENNIPLLYRVQGPPNESPPKIDLTDPLAFIKMRGVLQPATLSLQWSKHWGLGVDHYTQSTSPLRRYTDLVIQRQIAATLDGAPLPYDSQALLKVLAAAETTEKEFKRLEARVTYRWALEYVSRLDYRQGLQAMVLDKAPSGGYRAELTICGAQGILQDSRRHESGELLLVKVKSLRPRDGILRLQTMG